MSISMNELLGSELYQDYTNKKTILKSISWFSLPNNPSQKGYSAADIKQKGYEPVFQILDWLYIAKAELNNLSEDYETTSVAFSSFVEGIDDGTIVAKKALKDAEGNTISTTYETKAEASNKKNEVTNDVKNGTIYAKKYIKANNAIRNISDIDDDLASFKTNLNGGVTIVDKARNDKNGMDIETYAKSLSHSAQNSATQISFTISLLDKNGNTLDSETQVFNGASTLSAGLLSATDKQKINNIANDIAVAIVSAKAYADSKVLRDNLVSIISTASSSQSGLMSIIDKNRLDALYSLLGANADSDVVVNTINEVLAVFNNYPEGVDLANELATKVKYLDVINSLTSNETIKPLSAYQGKVLKELIDTLTSTKADANNVYTKNEVYSKEEVDDIADGKADANNVYTKGETYSQTQADNKFRTEDQVDDQIGTNLANVSNMNVISDIPNLKNYTHQILVRSDGELVLRLTEI